MKLRILVVDDEPTLTSMLRLMLEAEGNEVTTASSAMHAIELLHSRGFDVVLTDIRMESPTSGFDVARIARQGNDDRAILLMTAQPVGAWRESGADAMLVKPITMSILMEAIDSVLIKPTRRKRA